MSLVCPVLLAATLFATVQACAAPAPKPFYRLKSTLVIPSANAPNWDYLTYDSARDVLYVARREDGILIYDVNAKKIRGTIADTEGGNATTLVPELDRGFVTNLDGSLTVFQLSSLKTLRRFKVGENADNSFYEPVTRQLFMTMGDSRRGMFVDAVSGKVTGQIDFESEKLEGAAPDGQGNLFLALRDRDEIVRIDARTRKVTATWKAEGCVLPNGVAYDSRYERVLVTCRGEKPIVAVLDAATGRVVARPFIGRGNDVIIFDPDTRWIYTSNGFDGTLVVLQQDDADTYHLVEALTTRPYARTMALNPKTKEVYLVAAEGMVDPSKPWKSDIAPFYPNVYVKDTFTLLTYATN
jgi:hypothetical protein